MQRLYPYTTPFYVRDLRASMDFGTCGYLGTRICMCVCICIYLQEIERTHFFLSTHGTFTKTDHDLGSVTSATWWRKMFLLLIPLFSQQIRHPSMNKSALVCLLDLRTLLQGTQEESRPPVQLVRKSKFKTTFRGKFVYLNQ